MDVRVARAQRLLQGYPEIPTLEVYPKIHALADRAAEFWLKAPFTATVPEEEFQTLLTELKQIALLDQHFLDLSGSRGLPVVITTRYGDALCLPGLEWQFYGYSRSNGFRGLPMVEGQHHVVELIRS